VEILRRAADQVGFHVQKRRWAAERPSAWIVRNRRASRDVDKPVARAEAFRSAASTVGLPRRTWL
jgi:transposase